MSDPKPEVEITSAMLRAGLAVFNEWRGAPLGVKFGDVVKNVYTAMEAAKQQAPAQ